MKIRSITAPNPGPYTLEGTRTYLLGDSAVIDPGPMIESHVEAIVAAMPRLQTILITHRHADHAPAAVPLKRATGARIVAPDNVLDEVDRRIAGGETVIVENEPIEVIATPGHTDEHVCFLTSSGDLFTGDTVLGFGTTTIFPPDGDMKKYIESLRALRERKPLKIHPAHGPDRDDAVALLDEYIAHRLDRERQVIEGLKSGRVTVRQLRDLIYPDLRRELLGAAEIQIRAHLAKLEQENRVRRSDERFELVT